MLFLSEELFELDHLQYHRLASPSLEELALFYHWSCRLGGEYPQELLFHEPSTYSQVVSREELDGSLDLAHEASRLSRENSLELEDAELLIWERLVSLVREETPHCFSVVPGGYLSALQPLALRRFYLRIGAPADHWSQELFEDDQIRAVQRLSYSGKWIYYPKDARILRLNHMLRSTESRGYRGDLGGDLDKGRMFRGYEPSEEDLDEVASELYLDRSLLST